MTGQEDTHIRERPAVRDRFLAHRVDRVDRLVAVDPARHVLAPLLVGDESELDFARAQGRDVRLELVVERLFVQEQPVVMVRVIETVYARKVKSQLCGTLQLVPSVKADLRPVGSSREHPKRRCSCGVYKRVERGSAAGRYTQAIENEVRTSRA